MVMIDSCSRRPAVDQLVGVMSDTQTHALHRLALGFNWLGQESGAPLA